MSDNVYGFFNIFFIVNPSSFQACQSVIESKKESLVKILLKVMLTELF